MTMKVNVIQLENIKGIEEMIQDESRFCDSNLCLLGGSLWDTNPDSVKACVLIQQWQSYHLMLPMVLCQQWEGKEPLFSVEEHLSTLAYS